MVETPEVIGPVVESQALAPVNVQVGAFVGATEPVEPTIVPVNVVI
jgi:hypothetical protein